MELSISEKIKAIDNKFKQIKAQYNLDKQTNKISALSSGNVCKCKYLIDKDVLPEKNLLDKDATMKRSEYLSLGKELKAKTDIAKKNNHKKLHDTYELDKIIKK